MGEKYYIFVGCAEGQFETEKGDKREVLKPLGF